MLGQTDSMDDPVQWTNADITWSRELGYTLRIPLWAGSRALSIRENKLIQSIQLALSGRTKSTIEITAMTAWDGRAKAEPGEIAISTETMVTLSEAMKLREAISEALRGVITEVERLEAEDEASAKSVLARLRNPSSER